MFGRQAADVLERAIAGAGEEKWHVCRGCRLRQHAVGAGPEQARQAGGRNPEGARVTAAEQHGGLVAPGDIHQIAGQQPVLLKGFAVADEATLVIGTALDEVEGDARQLAPREGAQVVEVAGGLDVHGCHRESVAER